MNAFVVHSAMIYVLLDTYTICEWCLMQAKRVYKKHSDFVNNNMFICLSCKIIFRKSGILNLSEDSD